jgi:hypothetical protein
MGNGERIMRGLRLVFATLALAAAPCSADTPRTLSRSEMQTLPEAVVLRRVADQIADLILFPNPTARLAQAGAASKLAETIGVDPNASPATLAAATRTRLPGLLKIRPVANDDPSKALKAFELVSKPHATKTLGVCRMDTFWPGDLPVGEDNGADAPTRLMHIFASPAFRLLSAPSSAVASPADAAQMADGETTCAKLDPDKDTFFGAWSDAHAVRAAWLFQALKAGFRMKPLPFDLDCHDQTTPDACRGLIESELSDVLLEASCPDWDRLCLLASVQGKYVHVAFEAGSSPKIVRVELSAKFAPVPMPPRKP